MSIQSVALLVHYNLYASKRHFAAKFAEALQRQGVKVTLFNWMDYKDDSETFLHDFKACNPDFSCSFNTVNLTQEGELFYDVLQVPHVQFLVDPTYTYFYLAKSPYTIITCVDQFECDLMIEQGCQHVFFWPHAIEKELPPPESEERLYPVVLIGSCYDHLTLMEQLSKKLTTRECQFIEEAAHAMLETRDLSVMKGAQKQLKEFSMELQPEQLENFLLWLDTYARSIDRVELIRSITEVPVHVFGGPCWRDERPIRGWEHYLSDQPNVVLHPAVSYPESLEILKQTKICLNSCPSFKKGSHERIFASLACGALPLTTDNHFIRDAFIPGEDLLVYQPQELDGVNSQLKTYLENEELRQSLVSSGREKVMRSHTWDVRAKQLLEMLPPALKKIHQLAPNPR